MKEFKIEEMFSITMFQKAMNLFLLGYFGFFVKDAKSSGFSWKEITLNF